MLVRDKWWNRISVNRPVRPLPHRALVTERRNCLSNAAFGLYDEMAFAIYNVRFYVGNRVHLDSG